MENSRFGNRIKELRQQAGLNQRVVARLVGIDFSYLSKIEKGLVVPAREVILKLAEVLSGSTDELLTLAGKLPSDIIEQLHNNPAMLKSLRNGRVGKSRAGAVNGTSFGRTLKELREKAGMSQSELADELGISFTDLSKIENGIRPAPSEKLIYRLAEILHADSDELLAISGKVPAEVVGRLQNEKTMHALRSAYIKNMDRRDGVMHKLKSLFSLQGLTRVALPVVLVAAVAASLVFSAPMPVKAVQVTVTNTSGGTELPAAYLGQEFAAKVKIDITFHDTAPIERVDVRIFNASDASKKATLVSLPLNAVAKQANTLAEGASSGSASVAAETAANWGYYSTGSRVMYGYGYSTGTVATYNPAGSGGYGYASAASGTTSITYTIYWTPPDDTSWVGTYKVQPIVYSEGTNLATAVTAASVPTFTVAQYTAPNPPSAPYVPPASTTQPEETTPGTWDVTDTVTNTGTFTTTVTVQDENDEVS
ncbi:MAG: helix-turn-helix transcriptional regulator, partial [Dehalococcoidales bacterium]|nr:helix-turn-helix transcriptional regulator [Dehalococcoidales bacterium]